MLGIDDADGIADGATLGIADGGLDVVGFEDGVDDGTLLGIDDADGIADGATLGIADGAPDSVGFEDGADDGSRQPS